MSGHDSKICAMVQQRMLALGALARRVVLEHHVRRVPSPRSAPRHARSTLAL